MNPKIILTIERGCLIAAVANGSIDVIVQDNDIPSTQRSHVGVFTPEVITIAEMTARIETLNTISPQPTIQQSNNPAIPFPHHPTIQ